MDKRYIQLIKAGFRTRVVTHRPIFLAHAVTYVCNSRCKTCTMWHMSKMASRDLDTEEVFDLLKSARKMGMRGYYTWGGEPLIRKDIPEILEFAKKIGFFTVMNTNASLLESKADSISDNLDFIFVSLDYPNKYHDFIRGRKGSFNEVVNGIKKMLEIGKTNVGLASTISKLNFDKIEDLARSAMELDVPISFNAVEPTMESNYETKRTYLPVHKYGLDKDELKKFYAKLLELKYKGYPLAETKAVLQDYVNGKPFRCQFSKIFVYVSPEGTMFPCTYQYGTPPKSLNEVSFNEYFSSKEYREFVKKSEQCKVCLRTCVRMYSYSYDLSPNHFINLIVSVMKMKKMFKKRVN